MAMKAADVIRVLLELDLQVIHPRPSPWGEAAEIVLTLCRHAEGSFRGDLGDYETIDMDQVYRHPPQRIDQPILDHILKTTIAPGDYG